MKISKKPKYFASMVNCNTWLDVDGFFGEADARYTDADLKEYWDKEHDDDPVLQSYDTYEDWYKEATQNMRSIESSININAADEVKPSADVFRVYQIDKVTRSRELLPGESEFSSLQDAKNAVSASRKFDLDNDGQCNYKFEIECIKGDDIIDTVEASWQVVRIDRRAKDRQAVGEYSTRKDAEKLALAKKLNDEKIGWAGRYDYQVEEISAAADFDSNEDMSNVYMLMYYLGGHEGMESDEFSCECMFRAADLDDAKMQVADWEGTHTYDDSEGPDLTDAPGEYYADYFNDYFVDETDGRIYDSVDEWAAHSSDVNSTTSITASLGHGNDNYFGETAARMYGQQICDALTGSTISKRRDCANQPGGLIYEASALGLEWDRFLEALEGMCADGRAREIDDSTYKIVGGQPHPIRGLFGSSSYQDIDDVSQNYSDWGVKFIKDIDSNFALVQDENTGKYTQWSKVANRPLSTIDEGNEYIPLWFKTKQEALDAATTTDREIVSNQSRIDQPIDASEDAPYYLTNTDQWVHDADETAAEMEESEEFTNGWEEIATKQVYDWDGMYTDYTLYHNTWDDSYACVFGDKDLYTPEQGEFDWEGESEEEALGWFDSYEGFDETKNVYSSCNVYAAADSEDIVDWLAEHPQAYADACTYFGTDLSAISTADLIGWISEHAELAGDFITKFGPIEE